MTILDIIAANPYKAFFLAVLVVLMAAWLVEAIIFRPWSRLIRHLNIRKHGWPPPHCDADGDLLVPKEKDEE